MEKDGFLWDPSCLGRINLYSAKFDLQMLLCRRSLEVFIPKNTTKTTNMQPSTAFTFIFSKFLGLIPQNGCHQLAPFQSVFFLNYPPVNDHISHQWERKLIFPTDMLLPKRVPVWCLLVSFIGNDPRIMEKLYILKTRCGTAASQVAPQWQNRRFTLPSW